MAYDPIYDLREKAKRPPASLLVGDRGWWVRWLRRALQQHGFLAAGTPVTDYFDIQVHDALVAFQVARHITADGICGPTTLSHLAIRYPNYIGMETYRRGLEEAFRGAREIGGNNCGEWVKKYMGQEGLPWCVAFATWCYRTACGFLGEPRKYEETWSSSRLWAEARDKGFAWVCRFPGQAQTGDFVLIKGGPTGHRHTAIFSHERDGRVYVVEGNVRPRKWAPWQRDAVRIGSYPAKNVDVVKLRPMGGGA